jgi:1,4-dihydroxy-2-naphthoyl-CoA hydrolase
VQQLRQQHGVPTHGWAFNCPIQDNGAASTNAQGFGGHPVNPNDEAYHFRVQLHDTDSAGRLFFAHLFRHAHDAYEAFMDQLGLPLDDLIRAGEALLPLVHAEADYPRPMCHGDQVRVSLVVEEIRTRSFSIGYRFETPEGMLAATARTVHVHISRDGSPGSGLPESMRAALITCLKPEEV